MRALLIVDVQNDFLPGGALHVHKGDRIIPIINALQDDFDLIIATKDWHPEGHISFAKRHGKKPGESIEVLGHRQELWSEHCIQNTKGAEFAPALNTEKIAKVFYKGTDSEVDSYSTFFDNARLRDTGLGDYLREKGVDEITLVGLATDFCVKYSALDALDLGFKVTVVREGCAAIGDAETALQEMEKAGVVLT